MARDIGMLKDALALLGKKSDALVKALNSSDSRTGKNPISDEELSR